MKSKYAGLITGILFVLVSCEEQIIPDPEPFQINFIQCLEETGESSFDILTWNMEEFPKRGINTIENTAAIISALDADLIAIQEITGINDFNNLVANLEGWSGFVHQSNGLNLAYIYKEDEVNLTGDPQPLFQDESYPFPRPPLFASATHNSGLSLFLINIHLKCCDGKENENRRRLAAMLLKEYIDDKLPHEKVIVLGDFNDEISISATPGDVFYAFIADSLNYRFADLEIASGTQVNWSYPGWPSHIDHILITDELFALGMTTTTLAFDICDEDYFSYISDHRPLMIRLGP